MRFFSKGLPSHLIAIDPANKSLTLSRSSLAQQLRQLGDACRDPSCAIAGQ